MQAFAFNIRRDKFKDSRLRRAFNFALNFERINNEIFYGQYKRIASYFEGTELACAGLAQGQELAILKTVRGQVPPDVFETPYFNPVAGTPETARRNLLEAARLFEAAGFIVRDLRRIDSRTGEPLTVEFLPNRLGIEAAVRSVDDVQYQNRVRQWDFDIVVTTWPETLSPGNEQRDYWGSQAAA